YTWDFVIAPKVQFTRSNNKLFTTNRKRKNGEENRDQSVWSHLELDRPLTLNSTPLVRIVVGKVRSKTRLLSILQLYQPDIEGLNNKNWAKEALRAVMEDNIALGTSVRDWESLEKAAEWFANLKKNANRWSVQATCNAGEIPTWDMLENRQVRYGTFM
ncbi:hypothetical protein EDB81DRAFT_655870, partial [Dactylonectria macrodidyma]